MTAESIIGTSLKAYCAKCRGDRNCKIAGHHHESGEDADGDYMWSTNWYLLVCCGCDYVFAQSISTNSEEYSNYYNRLGGTETEYLETVRSWPARSKRNRPDWFEHGSVNTDIKDTGALDASLKELYDALDHELMVLASIGIRTSFDIAAEMLSVEPTKNFNEKLKELVALGLIRDSEKEHIDILVDAGSASAHRGWRPKVKDLETLMDTLEDFIYNTMVLPARKTAAAKKIAAVKAEVPPRPKKVKGRAGKGTVEPSSL